LSKERRGRDLNPRSA